MPSPTLFNLGASAEVTPGRGEFPALVSMLLANYCDGEALHVYQPSLPPRIAIRGLDCSALLNQNQNQFRPLSRAAMMNTEAFTSWIV